MPAPDTPTARPTRLPGGWWRRVPRPRRRRSSPARPARQAVTPLLGRSPRRWVRLVPWAVATVLTAILFPVTAVVLSQDYGLPAGLAVPLAFAQTAPLPLAVVRPLVAWWLGFTADAVGALLLLGVPPDPLRPWPWTAMAIFGCLWLCLALAARAGLWALLTAWLTLAAVSVWLGVSWPERAQGSNVLLIVLSGVLLLLGGVARERWETRRRLAEQETISEAERARRLLWEERARIARELHDVVAHHMSVITVQADSAPYRLQELPPAAREQFAAIADAARQSLAEMRRLLGVLRSEEGGGERTPQPGLDGLAHLVRATRQAGVPVELDLPERLAEPGRLPPAVGLSAYRIVQEALANVVRHAPGAATRVTVAEADGALTVEVVNGPPEGPTAPLEQAGTGHGLTGMRERVRLVDGALQTGPLPDGGYRVAARLPLRPPPPAAAAPDHDQRSEEAEPSP